MAQAIGIRARRAGEEVADDGRSFWRAVAPERRVHPTRWEEDVASLLNLLQQLQAWIRWYLTADAAPAGGADSGQSRRNALRHDTGLLADAGVENVNAQVDDLITTGVLRRVLAFTELKFSNSMIEAWWRFIKTSMAVPPLVG